MTKSPYPGDSLKRLQAIELEMLAVIDRICRANSLDYFVSGGTCLGAVRHGGFIPWDDDVDIDLPKADYDRFLELAPKALPEGYSLHTSTDTKGMSALWAKVYRDGTRFIDANASEAGCEQAVFIDVFPVCRADADPKKAQGQYKRARMAQLKSYLKHFSNPKIPASGALGHVLLLGCRIVHATIARTWRQASLQRAFDDAFDTSDPSSTWIEPANPEYMKFPEDVLFPTKDMEFGELTLRAPHDCDAYLTLQYGDYMQLPPEESRYTHAPDILDLGDGIDVMKAR